MKEQSCQNFSSRKLVKKSQNLHEIAYLSTTSRCETCDGIPVIAVHYGVKRTETHFDLCLNFILGQKVVDKKSRGMYFK